MHEARLSEIAAQLENITEELADLGRSVLADALEADDGQTSAAFAARERRLAQARRSIMRAVSVLQASAHEEEV